MQCIYKITNKINNKSYIGKTNNLSRRWQDHKYKAFDEKDKEYDKVLYKAFRKYGVDNFDFCIIEELPDYSISGEREQYWIKKYDTYYNGYNETPGGDGGSSKGHCLGETNGRAKLTEQDVIKIRTMYKQGISKSKCYSYFKDKITMSGFARVWLGETWQNIMPEVYTEENKKRNAKLGYSQGAKENRKYPKEIIIEIRNRKKAGEKRKIVYDDFKQRYNININTFCDIWYNKTYKEVIV